MIGAVIALASVLGAAEEAPPTRQGMDDDGRIPLGLRPDWVETPDRWRYVPERRLLGGSPFNRFLVSSFIIPIVTFEEATGAGLGVGIVDLEPLDSRRQYAVGAFAMRSTGGLERYTVFWSKRTAHHELPTGGVLYEERSQLTLAAGYERNPVRRFYGLGIERSASDETSYTDETGSLRTWWSTGLPHPDSDVTAGLQARIVGRNLAPGRQSGVPSTGTVHPDLVQQADGTTQLWAGGSLRWDVRDSAANPYHGGTVGLTVESAMDERGTRGGLATLDGVLAIPLPGLFHDSGVSDRLRRGVEENPPTDVLAFGGFVKSTWGSLPFPDLPSLGGSDTLRGYLADRYTGAAAWHASAEWRLWCLPRGVRFTDKIRLERVGIAPFVDVGSVAESLKELPGAEPRSCVGTGLRAMLERDIQFRLDVARSPEQWGVNFQFGMAF